MFDQWLEQVKQHLEKIEEQYPGSVDPDRSRLREEFHQIQQVCDHVLEGWISLEERVSSLLNEEPDLAAEEEEVGEEFWLDGQVVRSFREGQGYYQLKMFGEAKPYFDQVVKEAPDFLLGRVYLALSDFQQRKWDDAFREFHLVAETSDHPRFAAFARHMLGCVHVQRGEDEKAIRQFDKALTLNPENGDAWFNLGACQYRLGQYAEAIPYFFHALHLDRDDWEAMYYLSCCYKEAGEWEGVHFWRRAVYEKTNSPAVMETIAQDFEESGDVEAALRWYRKLAATDPKRASAYHGMSWSLWLKGCQEEALLVLQKGLTIDPRNPDTLFTYVWYLLQQGDLGQVEKALAKLPEEMMAHPLWMMLRSRLFVHCQEFDRAEEAARKVVHHQDPFTRSLGHYQLGRIFLDRKQIHEAAGEFQKAQQLSPHWKEPLFYQGLCHLLDGKIDGTRQCWEQISLAVHTPAQ
ncbi:tetratricopeptide repeat protein [Salinithrix halophila]|uniref:Tetratricopeptide repeat protein n=1 Tax=Salinithrix halophila TaxID=1485204 RepID=A0ABV8JH19_9BACL